MFMKPPLRCQMPLRSLIRPSYLGTARSRRILAMRRSRRYRGLLLFEALSVDMPVQIVQIHAEAIMHFYQASLAAPAEIVSNADPGSHTF
jgi:hypothetical protein